VPSSGVVGQAVVEEVVPETVLMVAEPEEVELATTEEDEAATDEELELELAITEEEEEVEEATLEEEAVEEVPATGV